MANGLAKTAKKLAIASATAALAAGFAARIATAIYARSDNISRGAVEIAKDPVQAMLSAPYLNLADQRIALIALCVFAITIALLLIMATRAQKLHEDTEHAHGDARLAQGKEISDLIDIKNIFNNIRYSEHAGLVFEPVTKKQREGLYGRNFNCVTLGISGLGKTFNLALPSVMQATGDALAPYPSGPANIIARASKRAYAIENPRRICDGLAGTKAERQAAIGQGYDIVSSDPKGGLLRDAGHMLDAAGFNIYSLNTVDMRQSCHVNPLAYIDTRTSDVKDPALIETKVECICEGEQGAAEVALMGGAYEFEQAQQTGISLTFGSSARTEQDSYDEAIASSESIREIEQRLEKLDPDSEEHRQVRAQLAMARAESDLGESTVTGEAIDAVRTYTYKRTCGTMRLSIENRAAVARTVKVNLKFDRTIVLEQDERDERGEILKPIKSLVHPGNNYYECAFANQSEAEITIVMEPATAQGPTTFEWTFCFHVHQQVLPDGAALTKLVDTFAANLGSGTDAASNNSSDPFWDDTKRLCFMALISLLFERYKPEERTIPGMLKLLNMALGTDGSPKTSSRLSMIFEEWENARMYLPNDRTQSAPDGAYSWMYASAPAYSWQDSDGVPHDRNTSLAVHCYHAFMEGAEDTVLSIIISCQAALTALVSDEVRELLSKDELHLDELGEPDSKTALFLIVSDTPSPYDFLTAMVVQLAIDNCQDRAYRRHGGKLPRHVRFELDEVANLGKIPVLVRGLAVVRSRNISISLYLQSKAQLALVYGEKEADVIFDNCTTWLFLGAQTPDTLELISNKIGDETVYSRVMSRSFNGGSMAASESEQITGTARKVRSGSQLQQMATSKMLVFIYNHLPIEDEKIKTQDHPLFRYVNPGQKRSLLQAPAAFAKPFEYREYLAERRANGWKRAA